MRLCALAVLLAVLGMVGRANAFCPVGCFSDDETLQVTCDEANLEVIPITLNPSVQVTIYFFISFLFCVGRKSFGFFLLLMDLLGLTVSDQIVNTLTLPGLRTTCTFCPG